MDATPNVEPQRPWRPGLRTEARADRQSAEAVRHQIYSTLDDLNARVEELKDYLHERFGSIDDPLHVREKMRERPTRVCGIAFAAGVVCGVLRLHRLPTHLARNALALSSGVVRGASATLGSRLASDLVGRAVNARWRSPGEE